MLLRAFILPFIAAASTLPSALRAAECAGTYVEGLVPLIDRTDADGGLYPGGTNDRPAQHTAAGVRLANEHVLPRDASGAVDLEGGVIGFATIGMSNTFQESQAILDAIAAEQGVSSYLRMVNGAQSGRDAPAWANPADPLHVWQTFDTRLADAGVAGPQLQIVWIKQAIIGGGTQSALIEYLRSIVQIARSRYPNLRMAYLSGRIYGGYASGTTNPEPAAYESSLAVRALIADQLEEDPTLAFEGAQPLAPWLSWGPYLWANGLGPDGVLDGEPGRSDGLEYMCSDFAADGTHPAVGARAKVAQAWVELFRNDVTSTPFFDAQPAHEPSCGDATCDATETCDSCTADCGACADPCAGGQCAAVPSVSSGGCQSSEPPAGVALAFVLFAAVRRRRAR